MVEVNTRELEKRIEKTIRRQILRFFLCSSIIYVNGSTVKYFSINKYNNGVTNVVVVKKDDKSFAYYWTNYDIKFDTIILFTMYEYEIIGNLHKILDQLQETPIDNTAPCIKNLYNYLKKGYKITAKHIIHLEDVK
jgi:hypothetical protein